MRSDPPSQFRIEHLNNCVCVLQVDRFKQTPDSPLRTLNTIRIVRLLPDSYVVVDTHCDAKEYTTQWCSLNEAINEVSLRDWRLAKPRDLRCCRRSDALRVDA